MKKFIVAFLAIVLVHVHIIAEIKNGYETRINETRLALENLREKINKDNNMDPKSGDKLTYLQKQKIDFEIDDLKQFIHNYELTEKLLDQFRLKAPDLKTLISYKRKRLTHAFIPCNRF